jgi:O-antigen ligase
LWFRGGSQFRAGGLIGETTAFGHLTATWMTLVFSLLVWTAERSQRRNWVLLTIGLVGLGMIFLSSSRAAMLNLMVFVASLWLMGRVGQRTFRNLMVLLICGMLTIVMGITLMFGVQGSGLMQGGEKMTRQLERFAPLGSADRFSSGRLEAWQIYSRKIRNHLWLGCGYKTATKLVHNRTPDNSVLSALLETGILGLLALCSFAILTTLTLWKRGLEGEPYAQALSAVWMGQVAQALTNDTHTLLLGIPVLYLVTGLVMQLDRSNPRT